MNPSDACELPRAVRKEIVPLEDDQISEFLKAIEGHVHEYLYKITMFTGMREGEVLGLTWDCIDFNRGTLIIKRQLVRDRQRGGEYHFSTPKNGKMRVIVLAPTVVELFQAQRSKQALMMLDAGKAWRNNNLIFTNPTGGYLSYRTVYDCFKRVMVKLGHPEARFHDLRHTYAVAAIKSGDDIKTVQENLGHATAAFTLDVYGHVTSQMKQASASRMEQFFLRLRDNGIPFNPEQYVRQFQTQVQNPSKNVGLRIVSGCSADMRYIPLADCNVVILHI